MPLQQKNKIDNLLIGLLLLFSAVAYFYIGYFAERSIFLQVILPYLLLFLFYFIILKKVKKEQAILIAGAGILLRLIFLFAIPTLSDDFLRFLWDGNLMVHDINPYAFKPSEVPEAAAIAYNKEMLELVQSKNFYAVYPPALQYLFYLAALIAPDSVVGSVIVLRSIILLAEAGTLLLLIKLIKLYKLSEKNILIYALNPLVIIELTGNLHFEVLMITFVLLAVFMILNKRNIWGAAAFSLAIAVKLIPLIFLPFLIRYMGWKKSIPFLIWIGFFTIILFLPFDIFLSLKNILASTRLYFQYFEFNASIYFILRWIGYQIYGYNLIQKIGVILSLITTISIIILVFKTTSNKNRIFGFMLFALGIYFFFATTINPWYIAPLIAFCTFTNYRWPVVWAVILPFTYLFYDQSIDNIWFQFIISIEYLILCSYVGYEILLKNKKWIILKEDMPYLKQGLK